jgi:hypothetical protein
VTSGAALSTGGPASLVIAFIIIGILMFCTVQALGELAVLFPVAGSFSAYSTRFLDPAWGFAMGWKYVHQRDDRGGKSNLSLQILQLRHPMAGRLTPRDCRRIDYAIVLARGSRHQCRSLGHYLSGRHYLHQFLRRAWIW